MIEYYTSSETVVDTLSHSDRILYFNETVVDTLSHSDRILTSRDSGRHTEPQL